MQKKLIFIILNLGLTLRTINSPTELTYEVLFLSNSSNFLTIKDVSNTYLEDVGFENGRWEDDWLTNPSYPIETIEIDTNVVFEGYFSLKLSSTDNGDDYLYFQKNKIIEGYYYISFSYYITSIEYGAYNPAYLYFSYKNINGWQDTVLGSSDSYVADRWQSAFIYAHIDQTTDYPFRILSHGAKFMMYFDNFRIFKTSTEIETIEPSKYEFSSTLRVWDGYLNPLVEGQQTLNTTLLERSSQTAVYSTNLTSTTGIFELEYNYGLEQKEYELWTYSYSSEEFNNCSFYFTPSQAEETDYAETELGDAWDFTEGDKDSWDAYDLDVYTIENGEAVGESDCTTAWDGIRSYTDYPLSDEYHTVYIRAKTNRTQNFIYWIQTDVQARALYFTLSTTWQVFELSFTAWIGETVTETRIQATTSGDPIKMEFDFIRLVHVDKPELIETDTNFYLSSSENTYDYVVYSDSSYLDTLSDLDVILKNNTVGNHNLTYVLYSASEKKAYLYVLYSASEKKAYLEETYQYAYTVEAAAFTVSLQSFYLSDQLITPLLLPLVLKRLLSKPIITILQVISLLLLILLILIQQ